MDGMQIEKALYGLKQVPYYVGTNDFMTYNS